MEESPLLFSMSLDPVSKTHLSETARWARFLAIVGFVFLGIMIATGIYSSVTISQYEESYREMGIGTRGAMSYAGISVAVIYIIMSLIMFFPLLFTLRFANHMARALNTNNQSQLNSSFQNLKICFRYLGIVTIVSLLLMTLTLVFGIASMAL